MNIPATFSSELSLNVQNWNYVNIKFRYFLYHNIRTVTEFRFQCTDNFQCSDNIQNRNDSFSTQLWTLYEHSHLNIHTICILNYERIIFECSAKHSWNVTWMLPCPLGLYLTTSPLIAWALSSWLSGVFIHISMIYLVIWNYAIIGGLGVRSRLEVGLSRPWIYW